MAVPKHGTPEWKPISETREANVCRVFRAQCAMCNWEAQATTSQMDAERSADGHNRSHSTTLATCCMYSDHAVCACGNVLV